MDGMHQITVKIHTAKIYREESGQSLIIVAGAIIALMAIIGLAVDLGLVYVERVRLARAMDAAALAGAQELPAEEAAHRRALEYLASNGFSVPDTEETCIESWGPDLAETLGQNGCDGTEAKTTIIIDTLSFQDAGLNSANRIRVRAVKQVPLTFMRVVGFLQTPVSASATAENIEDLDIVIVYDKSGSMQEDTRCYGCFVVSGAYPTGTVYPLPFIATDPPTDTTPIHCSTSEPLVYSGKQYISIEAEHYSRYDLAADYHRDWTEFPKTWWAMQRDPNESASGPDTRGAFMLVGPHSSTAKYYETIGDIVNPNGTDPDNYWTTPRLEYDFSVPVSGNYYVWIRAQGGSSSSGSQWADGRESRRQVYIGLGGAPGQTVRTCYWGPYNDGASGTVSDNASPPGGNCSTNSEGWSWSRAPSSYSLTAGTVYELDVWAAGQGFRLDKIVITNDTGTELDRSGRPLDWDATGASDVGPTETHGRTDWACMMVEDPRFNPFDPYNGERDDLYDDYQPIRAAKEAAKNFVRKLNPKLDQIGYVWYSTDVFGTRDAKIIEELYCLKQDTPECDGLTVFTNVVASIESTQAGGGTNIAEGLWDGIRVHIPGSEPADTGSGMPYRDPGLMHYGRPNAAHIIVLMTDGQANAYPTLPSGHGTCYADNVWPDIGITSIDRARECVIWFAKQALDSNIVIYTIGLGGQADNELLAYVADLTGGWYYFAPSADELDSIFDSLYERIFLRLTD